MIYRVVQSADGLFRCQYRMFLFWWIDSCHEPSKDKEGQISFAKFCEEKPYHTRILRVVWP